MLRPDAAWEVRSTSPTILGTLPLDLAPSPGDRPTREAAFSLIVDERQTGIRRLPSFFFHSAQLYAERDLGHVLERFAQVVKRYLSSYESPFFMFNACRLDGKSGLYGRDFLNRAPFRRKLGRLGMEFADDPFVTLDSSGRFVCTDWGSFVPSFLVLGLSDPEGPSLLESHGATLLFLMTTYRVGKMTATELGALGGHARRLHALNAREPETLVEAIVGNDPVDRTD